MSEIGAIKNAIRAERQLVQAEKAAARMPNLSTVIPPKKANVVKTATGKDVDISKGYNVRGQDGTVIPFNADTPLEKAKAWSRNFYRDDFDVVMFKPAKTEEGVEPVIKNSIVRDKKDPGNSIAFRDLGEKYKVHSAQVGEAYKGQGIGAGMYRKLFEQAKNKGVKVESDSRLSKDSFAVWQRFKQLGYPIKERPFVKRGDHYELAEKDLMKTPDEEDGIFEFDPLGSVPNLKRPQGVKDPVGDIDKNKPHLKVGGEVPQATSFDSEVRSALKGKNLPFEQRTEITKAFAKWQGEDDPAAKKELEAAVRQLLPTSESK